MSIDTHCHLDFGQFDRDRDAVIKRAREAGVEYLINVGSNLDGSRESVKLAQEYGNIFASVGIHPHHADNVDGDMLAEIEALAADKKVVAIGEVGLDYFRSPSPAEKQKESFIKFIELAERLGLPLIIHNRDAHRDTLDILKKTRGSAVSGVMHCFSGDRKVLSETLELGLHVSFTCNLTFKNSKKLRETARAVPKDRLLLETDAPFLAPQSCRGRRNEPAYITELRDLLSELLNLSKKELETVTTENAKRLFGIK